MPTAVAVGSLFFGWVLAFLAGHEFHRYASSADQPTAMFEKITSHAAAITLHLLKPHFLFTFALQHPHMTVEGAGAERQNRKGLDPLRETSLVHSSD